MCRPVTWNIWDRRVSCTPWWEFGQPFLADCYRRDDGLKAIDRKNLSLSSSDGPFPYFGLPVLGAEQRRLCPGVLCNTLQNKRLKPL